MATSRSPPGARGGAGGALSRRAPSGPRHVSGRAPQQQPGSGHPSSSPRSAEPGVCSAAARGSPRLRPRDRRRRGAGRAPRTPTSFCAPREATRGPCPG
eukprot:13637087-Alexandrium_andersonii.AAC.1